MKLLENLKVFLGAYSDRHGRKLPIIIGLIGIFLGNLIYIFVWWSKTDLPLQFLYLAAFLDGICGGFRMVVSSVNAYLSDQFEHKRVVN